MADIRTLSVALELFLNPTDFFWVLEYNKIADHFLLSASAPYAFGMSC